MLTGLLGILGVLTTGFATIFGMDINTHRNELEANTNFWISGLIGGFTNFFDALGIGSFAPTTALLRMFKQVDDRFLPGTLNVACSIPVVAEAFLFITSVNVEIVTLIALIAAATAGAYLGAGIVSKLPERTVKGFMGIALLVTAFLMLAGKMKWMPGGGEAIGLTGIKLIIGVVGNFILGALMTAGIGLYAPCMALVYFLGMSPDVAFPIMMGSCAFLMPVASIKFVREQAYNKKASLAITIFGVLGVWLAVKFFTSLSIDMLMWVVIMVVTYTGVTMLSAALKSNKE